MVSPPWALRCWHVPHSALREVVHQSPNVAQAFWLETLMQSAISREWVASLGRRDAVARTAHIICELAVRLQANGLARDLCFRMPWTQIDLADACGISNVHANRVVKELRQLGLAKWEPKRITIKDWHALVRVAEFDAGYLRYRGPGSQSSRSRIRHDGSTKHGQPVFHPFVSGGDEVSLNGPGQQTSRP
ncbi:Crp/Fnr family transcriptional regulator [Bradyrhizobium sp.]|uniref:Crp/Fnr family transcriptional regulator n=1 Tax=Bradyrhizobium sp. TaxID=376 RepID=UPI0025C0F6A7|nr:Crp/Fnr family transcriptional regulator [Bradyrhizobium sp.]